MPSSSGTFSLSNLLTLYPDDNTNLTQETSHVGEHNVDQEMESSHVGEHNVDQEMESSHVGEHNIDQEMVGLDIGKYSHDKQKKLRSDVWKKFEKCKDKDGNDLAKCSLCEKLFNGSSKKGTTHLRNHFKSCQNKRNEGGASGSGDKPAGNGGGASGSGDKPAGNSVTDQQLINEGGASGSGDKPAGNSVTDQQLINEGGASGSGDKPAGNSVTDQQLDHLDMVKMLIKQCDWVALNQVRNADIIHVYNEEKEKLCMYFKKLSCRFSLMIKSVADGKYTGFMVSFINDDWKLEEKIIGFRCIEGDQNMEVLKNMLLDLGIDNKIYSMVTNGSDERANRFSGQGSLLSNCKFCVRCFYDTKFVRLEFDDVKKEVLYDPMSKIFNYITETSSKIGTFQTAKGRAKDRARLLGPMSLFKDVTEEDIPTEEKLKDMYWFDLVKIALGLKEAFFELENMDPDFKSINLTKEHWAVLMTFYQFCLQDTFREISWHMDDFKTANLYFPRLCRMYKNSLVLETLDSFISRESRERYLGFVEDAKKCWDQYNRILAVAAVLDPRFKMIIVRHWYKKFYGDEWETQLAIFTDYFTGVYNEYAKGTNNFQSSTSGSKEKKSSFRMLNTPGNYSYYPRDQSHRYEFDLYLKHVCFPLIDDFDILEWWRGNSWYFPTFAKMARDFLPIKVIVPFDNKFLGCSFPYENFDSDIVKEAFWCTKSWLTN